MNKPTLPQSGPARRQRQRGSAAVELAVLMLFTIVLIIPTFVIGRTLWQYNALKHATYDAARYIAAVPLYQLNDPDVDLRDAAKLMVARSLIAAGVAPASAQARLISQTDVYCPGVIGGCRTATPDTIVVKAYLQVSDPLSLSMTGRLVSLLAISSVRYGN